MKLSFDIIIPNYNGRHLLEKYLPEVLKAVDRSSHDGKVLVADDMSVDGSCEFTREHYPSVTVIERKRNGGFMECCTTGINACSAPVFILLNNDILVDIDFIDPLLAHFSDPAVFAVSAKSMCPTPLTDRHDPSFQVNESVCQAVWKDHMFDKYQPEIFQPENVYQTTCTNLFGSGGYGVFHRGKFQALGGFDPLFKPYYWEDIDLCYRAWRHGWISLYEPGSRVYHLSHGTIREDADQRKQFLMETRNRFIFNWKHLDDYSHVFKHIRYTARLLIRKQNLDPFELFLREALMKALPWLPRVVYTRFRTYRSHRMTMEKIMDASMNRGWKPCV